MSMNALLLMCFRCDYDESFDLDPSASGSTVTLMGQMPTTRCDDSLQSVNNMPSPVW